MRGMDERTGKFIEGEAFLKQAVRRAVVTSKRTKRMLRWYGTNHLKYLDRSITQASVLELTSDLADSIEKTIPDSRLEAVFDQRNGQELLVSLSLGSTRTTVGV